MLWASLSAVRRASSSWSLTAAVAPLFVCRALYDCLAYTVDRCRRLLLLVRERVGGDRPARVM